MAPTDLDRERDRRARLRLARQARQAALHATPQELVQLERIVTAARQGHITITEATAHATALRRLSTTRPQPTPPTTQK